MRPKPLEGWRWGIGGWGVDIQKDWACPKRRVCTSTVEPGVKRGCSHKVGVFVNWGHGEGLCRAGSMSEVSGIMSTPGSGGMIKDRGTGEE